MSAPTLSDLRADDRLADFAGCFDPCVVTGRIPVTHPRWGPIEIVTFGPRPGSVGPRCGHELLYAIDTQGGILWSPGPPDTTASAPLCPLYEFGPAGSSEYGSSVSSAVDASGNIFLDWNPGRYNGVSVLVMTPDGFDDLDTLPLDTYGKRFYSSTVEDSDRDGFYEIVLDVNTCYRGCAGGPVWTTTFVWKDNDYVPRPERSPTWCGYYDIWEGGEVVADLRDVIVEGTSCFSVVSSGERLAPPDSPLIETLVRAHDRRGRPPTFEVSGWRCDVSDPRSDGAAYSCSGNGVVTFTRFSEWSSEPTESYSRWASGEDPIADPR
jgi:hypothetical protein